MSNRDYLFLLHGIARTSRCMRKIEKKLTDKFIVFNLDYPSRHYPIEELVNDHLAPAVKKRATDGDKKIHFVCHSMGGILTRYFIEHFRPDNLARVVMLGTPNHGSELADFLRNNLLYKKIYGPAGQQLTTEDNSLPNQLPGADYELGIIAGDRAIDPVGAWIIPGKNDGRVSVSSTKLSGMTDHMVIHSSHTFMLTNGQVLNQTLHFLENGKFL